MKASRRAGVISASARSTRFALCRAMVVSSAEDSSWALTSTLVNVFISGVVVGWIVLPILNFITLQLLGRKLVFVTSLGPIWLQVIAILLLVSFFRYWMHRFQHRNEFLWKLHSYHHRVTDLRATNGEVSNPVDFALRNVIVFLMLGIVGFNPFAILTAFTVTNVTAVFSHCGGDVRCGFLNYLFVTPEVHRLHHAVDVPKGYGHSCNYGVEFAFWDVIFGTYYLPYKDGQSVQPERIGHPTGIADESNYLKILLEPFGLYPPSWQRRPERIAARRGAGSAHRGSNTAGHQTGAASVACCLHLSPLGRGRPPEAVG